MSPALMPAARSWRSTLKGEAEISQIVDAVKVGVNFHLNASSTNLE